MSQLREHINIFIAYSRKDKEYLERLRTYLKPLERKEKLEIWYDGEIVAGTEWEQDIKKHLQTADMVVLLISAYSLASDYFYEKEVVDALKRHHAGESVITPIILRSCDWKTAEFVDLQVLPTDGKPLTKWNDEDDAYTDVVHGLRKTIAKIKQNRIEAHKKHLAEIEHEKRKTEQKLKLKQEYGQEINKLALEIESKRKHLKNVDRKISIKEKQRHTLNNNLLQIEKKVANKTNDINELKNIIETKKKHLNQIERKRKEAEQKFNLKQDYQEDIVKLESEIKAKTNYLKEVEREILLRKEENQTLNEELLQIKKEVKEKREAVEKLLNLNISSKEHSENLEIYLDELDAKVKNLAELKKEQGRELDMINNQVHSYKEKLKTLKYETQESQEYLKSITLDVERKNHKLNKITSELEKCQDKLLIVTHEINEEKSKKLRSSKQKNDKIIQIDEPEILPNDETEEHTIPSNVKKRRVFMYFLYLLLSLAIVYNAVKKDKKTSAINKTQFKYSAESIDSLRDSRVWETLLTKEQQEKIVAAQAYFNEINTPQKYKPRLPENLKVLFPNGQNQIKPYSRRELKKHADNVHLIFDELKRAESSEIDAYTIRGIYDNLVAHENNYYSKGFKKSDYRYIAIQENEAHAHASVFDLAQAKGILWKLLVEFNHESIKILDSYDSNGNINVQFHWETPRNDGETLIVYFPK